MSSQNDSAGTAATPAEQAAPGIVSRQRRSQLAIAALVIAAIAATIYLAGGGRHRETTEDAFVDGNVVAVTSQVGGVVTMLAADNTDFVTAGSTLVTLDDVDAHLARTRAEAQLAHVVRQVRAQYAGAGQARANVEMRAVELSRLRADLARRQQLAASGAVSGEEVKHAQDAVRSASAALTVARQQLVASEAAIDGTTIASNPDVLVAASQLRDAVIAERRTQVPAPVSGVITKRNAQIGQKIAPGTALMSVVPLDHLWVNANFKESQLRYIRIGQPVRLTADLYGSDVVYNGTVVGQDAGTGSAFSLLPAQNATGNWIKVVQRVPVRIALDAKQVAKHPLQLGLSMRVTVRTDQRDGLRLADHSHAAPRYETTVFANQITSADDMVRGIIEANQ